MNLIYSPFMSMSLSITLISAILALSSSNWIMIWLMMEINLLAFIPIMLSSDKMQETEGSIKYFTNQALGSAVLLMSSMSLWSTNVLVANLMSIILLTSILLKLGSFPCHFWYPSVMSSISWMSCFILTTWQKLAPLMMASFILAPGKMNSFLLAIGAGNAVTGGVMGLNSSKMRTIMAYSSIGHLGWMLTVAAISLKLLTLLYFIMYMIIIFPVFMILGKNNANSVKSLGSMSFLYSMTMALCLMSMGGLPPLSGFMPKLMVMFSLTAISKSFVLLLIMGSLMNLVFYLNIVITAVMSSKNTKLHMNSMYAIMIVSSTMSLILMPLVISS